MPNFNEETAVTYAGLIAIVALIAPCRAGELAADECVGILFDYRVDQGIISPAAAPSARWCGC